MDWINGFTVYICLGGERKCEQQIVKRISWTSL